MSSKLGVMTDLKLSCKRLGEHSIHRYRRVCFDSVDMQKLSCNLYAKLEFLKVKDWPVMKGSQPIEKRRSRVSHLRLSKQVKPVCLQTQTSFHTSQ